MPIQIGDIKLYDLDEIAKAFNVTKITIRGYLKGGKLKGEKMGKRWYVSEESLKEFFNKAKEAEKDDRPRFHDTYR